MKRTAAIVLLTALLAHAHPEMGATLYDVVAAQLVERYSLDTATNKVEILKSQIVNEAVDPAQVSIQPLFQHEPIGLVSLVATVTYPDNSVRRGQISLRVRKFARVAVTIAALKARDDLTADKCEIKLMDVTSLREQPVTSLGAIHGSRTKRNLAVGQILTAEAIETAPDIEVGREVTITFAGSAFTITTRGQAMQVGRRGEMIRVRNAVSGKTVLARVSGEGEVQVEL